MRNIHTHLRSEYGIESVRLFHQWERIKGKMADFKNHRRFSLRCLSEAVILVSIKLRSDIRTPKVQYIIRRAEKALLNERIRSVNNTIYMFSHQLDTCKTDLGKIIKEEDLKECQEFINTRREPRHSKTMDRQIQMSNGLCHRNSTDKGGCSHIHGNHALITTDETGISPVTSNTSTNISNNTNKWVINISSKPLTKAQEKLLAHRPNYTVVPRSPPVTEYVAVIEQVCSKLQEGEAEELRGEGKSIIKKTYSPPKHHKEKREGYYRIKDRPI